MIWRESWKEPLVAQASPFRELVVSDWYMSKRTRRLSRSKSGWVGPLGLLMEMRRGMEERNHPKNCSFRVP